MARIGEDLAKIRKIQGKTLEDVHRSSRIPVSVLTAIEDGSIFSSLSSNKTMIRSNVRSFARVLKLVDDDVIAALDSLEKGEDVHFLKADVVNENNRLTESSEEPIAVEEKTEKKSEKKETSNTSDEQIEDSSESEEKVTEEEPTPEPSKESATTEAEEESSDDIEEETDLNTIASTEVTNSVSNKEISDVDWERLNRKTKMKRPPMTISWVSVFTAVIILLLGSLYFVGYFDFLFTTSAPEQIALNEANNGNGESIPSIPSSSADNWLENNSETEKEPANTEPESTPVTSEVESTTTDPENPTEQAAQPEITPPPTADNATTESNTEAVEDSNEAASSNESDDPSDKYRFMTTEVTSLPQELEILVYAATDNLAPVRLQWDGLNSLRPYWVEVGQAMRVAFSSELRIRTLNYDRMILVFNGHPITNLEEQFLDEEAGLLVIPRSFFEADPSSWIRLKDPNEDFDGISRPSKIIDRPTFN
jgi:cytoskeletal protein RodZ